MGKCLPRSCAESDDAPQEENSPGLAEISMISTDYISALCSGDNNDQFFVSQEMKIVLYDKFLRKNTYETENRVKALSKRPGQLFAAHGTEITYWNNSVSQKGQLSGHSKYILAIDAAYHPELVSGGRDYSVKLWDIETTQEKADKSIERNIVTSLKWVEGSNQFVHCSEDRLIRLWDARTMNIVASINAGENFPVCCDVRDNQIVTGHRGFDGNGTNAQLWDMRLEKPLQTFTGHSQTVEGVTFTQDYVVTCSKDGTLRKWGLQNTSFNEVYQNPSLRPYNAMTKHWNGVIVANSIPELQYIEAHPRFRIASINA